MFTKSLLVVIAVGLFATPAFSQFTQIARVETLENAIGLACAWRGVKRSLEHRADSTYRPAWRKPDHRPEALAGPDRQSGPLNVDRLAEKWPVAPDFNRVAIAGAMHRVCECIEPSLRAGG